MPPPRRAKWRSGNCDGCSGPGVSTSRGRASDTTPRRYTSCGSPRAVSTQPSGPSRARARMIRALDSEPTRRWLEALTAASAAAPTAAGAFGERAMVVMPERVRRRFRKLRNSVRGLRSNSPMEDYHLVRRRAKQLRYAIESGALIFGKPAEDELKALRRLQDELGAHQDAYMARNRLAALAADPANELPAGTLFLMGRLAERHSTTTAQARKSLTRSWRKVRGQRWRALRSRLGELLDNARQG